MHALNRITLALHVVAFSNMLQHPNMSWDDMKIICLSALHTVHELYGLRTNCAQRERERGRGFMMCRTRTGSQALALTFLEERLGL